MSFLRKTESVVPMPRFAPAHAAAIAAAGRAPVADITGASSGIGHAKALVLAARNPDALFPVAMACRSAGAAKARGGAHAAPRHWRERGRVEDGGRRKFGHRTVGTAAALAGLTLAAWAARRHASFGRPAR